MEWVMFSGVPVYLDRQTVTRIINLGGKISKMKESHIPSFVPKEVTFTVDDVNKFVTRKKNKHGVMEDFIDWKELRLS